MKFAKGEAILMLDSDGATDINEYENLNKILFSSSNHHGLAIGSRNHLVEKVVSQRAWYRNILMHGNNFIVQNIVGVKNINDTQCGFKLFKRKSMRAIFRNMHLNRWAFDVEMLLIAQQYNLY